MSFNSVGFLIFLPVTVLVCHILPRKVRVRVAIEAASPFGWDRYVGNVGAVVAMHSCGASAPGGVLFKKFGFTKERVVETVKYVFKD